VSVTQRTAWLEAWLGALAARPGWTAWLHGLAGGLAGRRAPYWRAKIGPPRVRLTILVRRPARDAA